MAPTDPNPPSTALSSSPPPTFPTSVGVTANHPAAQTKDLEILLQFFSPPRPPQLGGGELELAQAGPQELTSLPQYFLSQPWWDITPHTWAHSTNKYCPPTLAAYQPTAALTVSRPHGLQPGSWFSAPLTHLGGHNGLLPVSLLLLLPLLCPSPHSSQSELAMSNSDHLSRLMNSLQWLLNRLRKKSSRAPACAAAPSWLQVTTVSVFILQFLLFGKSFPGSLHGCPSLILGV